MKEIKVTVSTEIDPKDISIDCSTASEYCPSDLKCEDCPFDQGSSSLDEIICWYTAMLAAKVKNAAD